MNDLEKLPDTSQMFDALVRVYISHDLLEATMSIAPPKNGGAEATPLMIDDALKNAQVKYGLDTELIDRLKENPVYSQEFVVARGDAPVNGVDGQVSYNFTILSAPHPKVLDNGTVDYRDLGLIENAQKGKVLCNIVLPTDGTAGVGINGSKLVQRQGRAAESPLGRNTILSEDHTRVTAAVDGHVTLVNSKVNVDETFVVRENVDNSTGNINFIGNVQIYGSVLEDFVVEAGGNIEISGTVEGGTIKAGGNISVRGGIVGKSHSLIECKGSLASTFLENCAVNADGAITAESIMNCRIRCGQSLELVGIRAKLIGGSCVVCRDITANVIGSPANLITELFLGADPAIMTRHAVLLREIELMKTQAAKLNQIVALLTRYEAAGKLPPDKQELLQSSKLTLDVNRTKLSISQKELEYIRKKIENSGNGKVVCKGVMYRGVRLIIGISRLNVEEPYNCSAFTVADGEIKVTSAV